MPDQAYTNRYGVINNGSAPSIPTYRRTFEQRRALSMQQCEDPGPHKGRARRWRRELQSRATLDWLASLAAGERHQPKRGTGLYSLRELLDGGSAERPAWVRSMQHQARNLHQLAERHGPASGWGIAQPPSGAAGNPKWTPYWTPKKAEKNWRWWRRVALTLRHLLDVLSRALLETVPVHRQLSEQVTAEKNPRSSPNPQGEETTGYRDHSTHGWEAALERLRARATT